MGRDGTLIERLRIFGKTWRVYWVPENTMAHANSGTVHYRNQEINISLAQHNDQAIDTLLHEAIHAIDNEMHLELSEQQVQVLACSIMALLRDNPELALALAKGGSYEWERAVHSVAKESAMPVR